MKNKKYV